MEHSPGDFLGRSLRQEYKCAGGILQRHEAALIVRHAERQRKCAIAEFHQGPEIGARAGTVDEYGTCNDDLDAGHRQQCRFRLCLGASIVIICPWRQRHVGRERRRVSGNGVDGRNEDEAFYARQFRLCGEFDGQPMIDGVEGIGIGSFRARAMRKGCAMHDGLNA